MREIPALLTKVNSARTPGNEGTIVRVRASACKADVRWPDGTVTTERFEEIEYASR